MGDSRLLSFCLNLAVHFSTFLILLNYEDMNSCNRGLTSYDDVATLHVIAYVSLSMTAVKY